MGGRLRLLPQGCARLPEICLGMAGIGTRADAAAEFYGGTAVFSAGDCSGFPSDTCLHGTCAGRSRTKAMEVFGRCDGSYFGAVTGLAGEVLLFERCRQLQYG